MTRSDPVTTIDPRYGETDATATPWTVARGQLKTAMAYWLTTVRPDGRPHVTTIAAVWFDDALHFTTGAPERKAKNLADNRHVVVTVGTSAFEGLDVVLEGHAVRVTDPAVLQHLADAYRPKYGETFQFHVRNGCSRAASTTIRRISRSPSNRRSVSASARAPSARRSGNSDPRPTP